MTDEAKSNRRDFLSGQSAFDAVRQKIESNSEADDSTGIQQPASIDRQTGYAEQYAKNAMACEFELLFNLHQYPLASSAAMEAFQLIDALEDQLTVYREHSEVSQLNQNAAANPVVVEPRLFELLNLALEIHRTTGRAFDITSSLLTKLWGFDKRSGKLPESETIEMSLDFVGSENLLLDDVKRTMSFAKEGISINLGGIGKGFALDRVGGLFRQRAISDFVVHGGQSSVLAAGSSKVKIPRQEEQELKGKNENKANDGREIRQASGWSIGITHPTIPGVRLGEVNLVEQALGTSGTARQGFYHQGKRYGHIIDPRTGWPASHFLSTTVIAPSAAQADALATAFYVMSREEVHQYCNQRPDIAAILVSANERAKAKVDVETINLLQIDGIWIHQKPLNVN